uniref:acetate--CoA ligase n=1 Tax=Lygus hesperus TaxID=30085 RepID=A0A0A9XKE0_LYGHE
MYYEVVAVANILKSQYGIGKGDCVCVYLPMIPFAASVMLACARIGAVVSVIFGGYSSQSLTIRLEDAKPKLLVTVDASFRGDKPIKLKCIADEAMSICE